MIFFGKRYCKKEKKVVTLHSQNKKWGLSQKIFINFNTYFSMNKAELVAAVAANAEISKVKAAAAVEGALDAIVAALKKGENVQLIGFGTFSVVKKAARKGINPATKAVINIPAKNVVKFKAGAKMAL